MAFKVIYLLVEGDDDERIVVDVFKPSLLEKNYQHVIIWKYANRKKEKIRDFVRTLNQMGAEYVYVCDLDTAPCVTERKAVEIAWLPDLEATKLLIVKREIECWYLAGMSELKQLSHRINVPACTMSIAKEDFDRLVPPRVSRTEFLLEILADFSLARARERNQSFDYALRKYAD